MDQNLNAVPKIAVSFKPYGFFLAPFIMGSEFDRLQALASWIDQNPPSGDNERKLIETKISEEFRHVSASSQIRARSVWLGLQTAHFNEYSHMYETAIFCYYKQNFPAVVTLLLSALEGIILSVSG